MSVLSCDRKDCKNDMCNRHSHRHGYICDECFKELVDMMTYHEDFSISWFMQTPKLDPRDDIGRRDEAYERASSEFRKRT